MINLMIVLSILMGVSTIFYLAALFGAPVGEAVLGGHHKGKLSIQGKVMTSIISLLLIGLEFVLSSKVGWLTLFEVSDYLSYTLIFLVFVLMIAHMVSQSAVDRYIWAPNYLIIVSGATLIMLSP